MSGAGAAPDKTPKELRARAFAGRELPQPLATLPDKVAKRSPALTPQLQRPHRTLGLQTPGPGPRPATGPIRSRPVQNGLHHVDERVA